MSREESALALYRKYRSTTLDEVVGQDHITTILKRSLEKGRVAHAYLLTGPRGVGKTSIARILAHAINGLPYKNEDNHLDIIEIDAASNNGVDDIRDLRDKVQIAPVSARKKVYIIDEVHMLSKAAFNALLKTLEEPPAHVVFILATTDVEKLPDTIISRSQQFTFRSIPAEKIVAHLKAIAATESISIDTDTLELIAERGGGSFRDSIGLLDQLSGLSDDTTGITRELAENLLGLAPKPLIDTLAEAVIAADSTDIIAQLKILDAQGIQPSTIAAQLFTPLQTHLTTHAAVIDILDRLVAVARSPRPDVSLLTALIPRAPLSQPPKPQKKTAAVAASAPIPSLEVRAEIEPLPHTTSPQNDGSKKTASSPQTAPVKHALPEKEGTAPATATRKKTPPSGSFDWSAFVAYMQEHYVAAASILTKCKGSAENETVTIYAVNAFYKKKLDDTKYLLMLHAGLEAVGVKGYEIVTIPAQAPLEDSQAAAVAAIMGGGEEVSLDDV